MGGLDLDCWDAVGKHLKQPVYTLIVSAVRREFNSKYFVPGSSDIAEMTARAKEAVGRGFRTIYYKFGIEEERDVELVLKTRESIGNGPRPSVDANEIWSPSTATRILSRMRPANLEYVEQPVLMRDIAGLALVSRLGGVPVASNQTSWGRNAILEIIRREAADVIMTDFHREGGLPGAEEDSWHVRGGRTLLCQSRLHRNHVNMTSHMHVLATSSAPIHALQGHPDYLADDYVTRPVGLQRRQDAAQRRAWPRPGD